MSITPGFSPTLAVQPTSVAEDGAAKLVTVTATLGNRVTLQRDVPVTVSVGGGTATAGTDYTEVDDFTVTVQAGKLSAMGTFTLTPIDDEVDEGNETVEISGTATSFVDIAKATLTITDDDTRGLKLSKKAVTVTEAAGTGRTATYTVALTSQPTAAVTVAVASGDETAATVMPTMLSFTTSNWKMPQTVTVTGVDDAVDNTPDRTTAITHTASGGDYGSVTGDVAVTVTDDEGAPVFSVADASVIEGDSGTATLEFAVTLSPAADMETTVDWATSKESGDSATPGVDYTAGSGTLTFAAGDTSKMVTVTVTGDVLDEENETLTLTLSNPSTDTAIGTATATGTITDDDAAPTGITLTASPDTVAENVQTAPTVTVTATVNGSTRYVAKKTVTVTVGADGDSAVEGTDYETVNALTIVIPAGAASGMATFTLTPTNDQLVESTETISVTGTSSGGETVTGGDQPHGRRHGADGDHADRDAGYGRGKRADGADGDGDGDGERQHALRGEKDGDGDGGGRRRQCGRGDGL